MIRNAAFALLAALSLAACDGQSAVTDADVIGVEWRLASITSANPRLVVPEAARYTLTLGTDGRVSVRSDCNSCGGGYTLAPSTLAVTPLACTRAYCGDTSLDPAYPQLLQGARSWEVADDGRLVITAADATLTFTR
jgi:heat shock protein HslJ